MLKTVLFKFEQALKNPYNTFELAITIMYQRVAFDIKILKDEYQLVLESCKNNFPGRVTMFKVVGHSINNC